MKKQEVTQEDLMKLLDLVDDFEEAIEEVRIKFEAKGLTYEMQADLFRTLSGITDEELETMMLFMDEETKQTIKMFNAANLKHKK
jgi:hypothetical protein